MKYLESIDWDFVWSIIKDVVIPHSGRLILNVVVFLVIGLVYSVILGRKGVFKRGNKYYNWAVKLYIPLIIGLFL